MTFVTWFLFSIPLPFSSFWLLFLFSFLSRLFRFTHGFALVVRVRMLEKVVEGFWIGEGSRWGGRIW